MALLPTTVDLDALVLLCATWLSVELSEGAILTGGLGVTRGCGAGISLGLLAIVALLVGILPNIPGFLLQIKLIAADAFPEWVNHLYNYAWFVGFAVSGVVYYLLMKNDRQ